MSKQEYVKVIDDFDGESEAAETIIFSYRGKTYEIDLKAENATAFDEAIGPYIEVASPISGSSKGAGKPKLRVIQGGAKSGKRSAKENAAIRAWAIEQGLDVSKRGRLKAEIVVAYYAAHKR